MLTRKIADATVSAIGLGAMPMSIEGRPDRKQAIATIHTALDIGITLIDTADSYHRDANEVGHNEELIAEALRSYGSPTNVFVATKAGHLRPGDGSWTQDGSPEHIIAACEASLRRLGVEAIDLFQFHRPDPMVPFAESVGALRELLDAGKIVRAGVSNVDEEQIVLANEILGGKLASVQNQFSPAFRSSLGELKLCERMSIAFLPWSPLGGIGNASELGERFAPFQQVADARGVSPQQVALAWELALAPVVIPIPGARRAESIIDSAAALTIELTDEELASLS